MAHAQGLLKWGKFMKLCLGYVRGTLLMGPPASNMNLTLGTPPEENVILDF